MAQCSCGRSFYPPQGTKLLDENYIYCGYCRSLINKNYSYLDREYALENISGSIIPKREQQEG